MAVTAIAFIHIEDKKDCRFKIFQPQTCNSLYATSGREIINMSSYDKLPEVALPSRDILKHLVCKINISEEMNLLKMKKLPFIDRFKNPCWYENKTLRCLPYLHMVGTAKCGTTDFFDRISIHPDVIKPSTKEPSWLSSGRFYRGESFSYYTSRFFSPIADQLADVNGSSKLITGDASVFNLHGGIFWPYLGNNIGKDEPVENNPEYIYHLYNETRIMILLRNPIERLWSEYLALSKQGNVSAEAFHEIVLNAIGIYKTCFKTRSLRSCLYDEPLARWSCMKDEESERVDKVGNCRIEGYQMVMLHRGVYHVFIRDYLKVFAREHVLIMRMEDIAAYTEKHLIKAFYFLGLDIPPDDQLRSMLYPGRQNARRSSNREKGNMLEPTRRILYDFYKPHNEQLAELLGDVDYNYGPR